MRLRTVGIEAVWSTNSDHGGVLVRAQIVTAALRRLAKT